MIQYLPLLRSQPFAIIQKMNPSLSEHKCFSQHCMRFSRGRLQLGLRLWPVGTVGILGFHNPYLERPGGRQRDVSETFGRRQEMGHG